MLDRPEEYTLMRNAEDHLWWYKMLHSQVIRLISSEDKDIRILDLGCGTGGLLQKLATAGFNNISGVDVSTDAVNYCLDRGFNVVQGNVEDIDQQFEPGSFDIIICNDVLCYFTLDKWPVLLTKIAHIIKPSGKFISNVPTLKAFRGMHDKSVGIVHRTNKSELTKIIPVGFSIINAVYWPFYLSPIIFLVRSWQRLKMSLFPKSETVSDVNMPAKAVNQILWYLTLMEKPLGSIKPWGSSLLFVLEKNEA